MPGTAEAAGNRGKDHNLIHVADQTLCFRDVKVEDLTPTGAQLARSAGFKPVDGAVVLQVLPDGALESVRPEEVIDLTKCDGRFVIVASDRIYLLTVDGQRFEWPCRIVSGGLLRKLAKVPEGSVVYLQRRDEPDLMIGDHDLVDLDMEGIEAFVTGKASWKLNVHGVVIDVSTSTVAVRAAMEQAGFDVSKDWHVFLKVRDKPKREVDLDYTVDLKTPGIEKLRLMPRNVDNGEVPQAPRRDFALLAGDAEYLDRLMLRWETIIDGKRRWLVIHRFPLPTGYTARETMLALEIPDLYPGAALYGFYANPALALASGRAILRTQLRGTILGNQFHGWSRHRGRSAPWDPETDSVVTHLGLVDAALTKEVGE